MNKKSRAADAAGTNKDLADDFRAYAAACLKIQDKAGNIVPFEPNPGQERLIRLVEDWQQAYPDPADRPTLYIIILKARQIGFSTCTEALFFHRLNFAFNTAAMVVSYDEDSAANISDMAARFYQHLPAVLKPRRRAARGKGLLLENPGFDPARASGRANFAGLQSRFLIETAGNARAGSSYTLNCLHLSEVAKWPGDVRATLTSILQAVPDRDGIVVVESTANGYGNHFHRLWQGAKEGENGFIPLFVPWHAHAEYSRSFADAAERAALVLDEEEKNLVQAHRLTLEQLNWRRAAIRDKCGGDPEVFRQEYPSDDAEAFLMSGRPRFDRAALAAMLAACRAPAAVGNIIEQNGRVAFVRQDRGYLSVWQQPADGAEYIISADVAEGLAHGDYSSADVLDRKTLEQAAHWHGHIDPDLFGVELARLARYYNRALVVPEVNNHGLTTVTSLRKAYPRIYRRRTVDKVTNRIREEYGWQTNAKTKPLTIDKLAELIRERLIKVNCRETIAECLAYCVDEKGGTGAPEGGFDDRVMSLAIGAYVCGEAPPAETDGEEPEYARAFGRTNY